MCRCFVAVENPDFAEVMLPGQADLVPGDVLCIGPDGRVVRSMEACQFTVVGFSLYIGGQFVT